MGRILIVEDEATLAGVLRDYLLREGFTVSIIDQGEEVVPWLRRALSLDLILLDLMLPGKSGLEICAEIRGFSAVPVIMITARVEELDRLKGLELGADDYICKPFSPREVVARVKAVLRRTGGVAPIGQATGLAMNELGFQATWNGHRLELTAVEFKLLQYLASRPGQTCSRQFLMDRIYPDERVVADRTIDSHIKKLRKKLVLAGGVELIHSVYGVGYRFEAAEPAGREGTVWSDG